MMNLTELMLLGRTLERLVLTEMRPDNQDGQFATPVELLLVSEVYRHSPISIGDLTKRTGFAQSYVSTLVSRMAERNLIVMSIDQDDRRRTLISPHPQMLGHIVSKLGFDARPLIAGLVGDTDASRVDEIVQVLEFLLRCMQHELEPVTFAVPDHLHVLRT